MPKVFSLFLVIIHLSGNISYILSGYFNLVVVCGNECLFLFWEKMTNHENIDVSVVNKIKYALEVSLQDCRKNSLASLIVLNEGMLND